MSPSAPAIYRLPLRPARTPTIVCVCCGETMKLFHTITKLGVRPEKHIFVCPFCKRVDYKELRNVA